MGTVAIFQELSKSRPAVSSSQALRADVKMGPLSREDLESFVERGWTVLRGAFGRDVAEAVLDALSLKCACDLRDPNAWTVPSIWLQEAYSGSPWTDAVTPRFAAAMDQLVGPNRWEPLTEMGWWPIRFPGFDDPPYGDDWHVEGSFPHLLTSPEQAVLNLFLFTDLEPGGGATLVAEGSHLRAAQILASVSPSALGPDDHTARVVDTPGVFDSVVEACGAAGDVVLAHPLLLHSSSHNRGVRPRVMAQPRIDCVAPKRIEGPDLSPVEVVLARALAPITYRP
jgi:Phytanoyl-CoA dioxygenase (PhyH)